MKIPQRFTDLGTVSFTAMALHREGYMVAWSDACEAWLKWHEELRLALGAQPGDDLIEHASNKGWRITIDELYANLYQRNDVLAKRDKEIESLRAALSEKDEDIEALNDTLNRWREANMKLRAEMEIKDKDIEGWQEVVAGRGAWIDDIKAKIASKDDLIEAQRVTIVALVNHLKGEKNV